MDNFVKTVKYDIKITQQFNSYLFKGSYQL